MRRSASVCISAALVCLILIGCSTTPQTAEDRIELNNKVESAIAKAKKQDPSLQKYFDTAAGYAVFPTVGKGAVVVGGAYGKGELYEDGKPVGYCTLTQATIGLALGGQAYTEIIFFETDSALNRFKSGNFAFAAQASAVALESGAGANAKYVDEVAVFTMSEAGLMFEASIGGQKFSYEPKM
jgi:lipid-binding SYLF domain-containing protein